MTCSVPVQFGVFHADFWVRVKYLIKSKIQYVSRCVSDCYARLESSYRTRSLSHLFPVRLPRGRQVGWNARYGEERIRIAQERVGLAEERLRITQERIEWRKRAFFMRRLLEHHNQIKGIFDGWMRRIVGWGANNSFRTYFAFRNVFLYPIFERPSQEGSKHQFFTAPHLYDWAMTHIETGYSDVAALIKQLPSLIDSNNNEASKLIETIESEVNDICKSFTDLTIAIGSVRHENPVLRVAEIEGAMSIDKGRLCCVEEGVATNQIYEVASGPESRLMDLKAEIERVRALHQSDFAKIVSNIERFRQLRNAIGEGISKAMLDVDSPSGLMGECDFEKSSR